MTEPIGNRRTAAIRFAVIVASIWIAPYATEVASQWAQAPTPAEGDLAGEVAALRTRVDALEVREAEHHRSDFIREFEAAAEEEELDYEVIAPR